MPTRRILVIWLPALCGAVLLLVPAAAAAGTLSPTSGNLGFGTVPVGGGGGETITFTNSGTTTMMGTATIVGKDADQFEVEPVLSDCDGAVLEDTESCIFHVVFLPTSAGEKEATLVVTSDATNPGILVFLHGVAIAPELSISPSPFDFGTIEPGSKSPAQGFSVENVGTELAAIESAALSGSDPDQFQIEADACSSEPLGQGSECSLSVVFAPTSPGTKSATLEVPSDDPESPATVAISGTGAAPPPAGGAASPPAQGLAPAKPSNAFSFGKVVLNKSRGTASLSVKVPGPGVLVLGGKGIVARKGPGAAAVVGGSGLVRLAIAAAGRKRAALNRTGRTKVLASVTYIPNGGDPLTKSRRMGLVKSG